MSSDKTKPAPTPSPMPFKRPDKLPKTGSPQSSAMVNNTTSTSKKLVSMDDDQNDTLDRLAKTLGLDLNRKFIDDTIKDDGVLAGLFASMT